MSVPSRTLSHSENVLRRKDDDRRSVLEPAHFLAFAERGVAGQDIGAAVFQAQQHIEKLEADAGNEHRRNQHQCDGVTGRREFRPQQGAFVLAEQLFDPAQCDRVDVPGIAGHVGHLIDAAIMRRVKAVVHARGQPQCDVTAVAVGLDQIAVAEQFLERVGEALDLIEASAGDGAGCPYDGVARAHEDFGAALDRARAVLELADEAIVHAAEFRAPRLPQIEIGEEAPEADGDVAHQRLLDLAEPAHELGQHRRGIGW